jgi:glycosyltransferase involved in cell wall biosynthesis
MKIGIFLPNATFDLPGSAEVGGIETFSFTVGEALQRLGHEVVLFGGALKEGRVHRATTLTLELHSYWETKSIPDIGTRFQRLVQRLHFGWSIGSAWRRQRCDAVLLAKPFDWPVAWNWKRSRPNLKVVMGFHGTDFFAGDTLFYGSVDAAFAVSPAVAELAEKHVGHRPVLIPNPVDVDFFSPGEAEKISAEEWHLISSGRLVGWKGFGNLLEAVARLQDEHGIQARLSLAGDGPERAALMAKIAELKLGEQVRLCGLLDVEALRGLAAVVGDGGVLHQCAGGRLRGVAAGAFGPGRVGELFDGQRCRDVSGAGRRGAGGVAENSARETAGSWLDGSRGAACAATRAIFGGNRGAANPECALKYRPDAG